MLLVQCGAAFVSLSDASATSSVRFRTFAEEVQKIGEQIFSRIEQLDHSLAQQVQATEACMTQRLQAVEASMTARVTAMETTVARLERLFAGGVERPQPVVQDTEEHHVEEPQLKRKVTWGEPPPQQQEQELGRMPSTPADALPFAVPYIGLSSADTSPRSTEALTPDRPHALQNQFTREVAEGLAQLTAALELDDSGPPAAASGPGAPAVCPTTANPFQSVTRVSDTSAALNSGSQPVGNTTPNGNSSGISTGTLTTGVASKSSRSCLTFVAVDGSTKPSPRAAGAVPPKPPQHSPRACVAVSASASAPEHVSGTARTRASPPPSYARPPSVIPPHVHGKLPGASAFRSPRRDGPLSPARPHSLAISAPGIGVAGPVRGTTALVPTPMPKRDLVKLHRITR